MAENVDSIRTYIEKTFPGWVKRDVVLRLSLNDLTTWNGGEAENKLSIGDFHASISYYELKKFILDNLDRYPDTTLLAHATRLETPQFLYAIGVQKLNTNSGIGLESYANALAQLITLGWRDHAELHARLGLQEIMKHSIQRGDRKGGALHQGQTFAGFTYMLLDVMQDWLKADKTSTDTPWRDDLYEDYAGGYGGWEELAENWREPDANAFAGILHRAADYHVAQSRDMETKGHDNDPDQVISHFEIEQDRFWLYPVILFTFLRLREWEGLPNPEALGHDLFQKGIFRHLPPVPKWPEDPFYDEVDARFRAMFPETPSLKDLPRLRAEQS
jgi:hypothetical protein